MSMEVEPGGQAYYTPPVAPELPPKEEPPPEPVSQTDEQQLPPLPEDSGNNVDLLA